MRVLAVAVTFNPDPIRLSDALQAVTSQVQGVLVVDNASSNLDAIERIASGLGAGFIANDHNAGIAAAQNQGIAFAQQNRFSHVLLLDQDTILSAGVIADLSRQLLVLEEEHGAIAAIGPAYFEHHSMRRSQAYRSTGLQLMRIPLEGRTQAVSSDFIIASGSLIPTAAFETVGTFNESLFIDLVDVDWCLRARAIGLRVFILPTAAVDHQLGSGTVSVGRRQVALHAPVRDYYWVRNALWLARQHYTPPAWRLSLIRRSLAFLATFTIFADQRGLRLRLMGRGILDSLSGRLGPLKQG